MKNLWLLLSAVLILTACDTPEGRIKRHPELYEKLSPEVQESVRQGKVAIGYPKEAVIIAIGKPDRRYHRETEDLSAEIWSYVQRTETTTRQRIEGEFRVRDAKGRWYTVRDRVWVDVPKVVEHERMRITFRAGTVIAIDSEAR